LRTRSHTTAVNTSKEAVVIAITGQKARSKRVKKLEEKGLDPKRAFYAFDEDCDEVLTVEEIKKGLKYHKVYLLDNEMRELVRAMDDNHDGVVSITEWENIL
jgi:Ca2+-binding EF-hand superfamily protein